jgi:hypothetical protein
MPVIKIPETVATPKKIANSPNSTNATDKTENSVRIVVFTFAASDCGGDHHNVALLELAIC